MKKALVILLCALAVFAIVSCKNEPEPQPKTETFNVIFDTRGGSVIAPATVEKDAKVEKPANPTNTGAIAFAGWYTEVECLNEYNFDTPVTKPFTLYAKWDYGKTYRITSTKFTSADGNSDDKFVLGFADAKVKAGSIVSLSFRTTEPFPQFSVRKNDPSTYSKWFHEKTTKETYPLFFSTFEEGADGWTTVSYVFPEPTDETQTKQIQYGEDGTGFFIYFRNQKMVPGAFMEVRAVKIDGVEVEITDKNINHALTQCAPILEIVEEEWTPQTVKFDSNGGTAIADQTVDFGKRATRPATDPVKLGVMFIDWYEDAEFTEVFDFANTPITEPTTIYARYGAPTVVTFDSQGGSAVEPKTVPAGSPVAKPDDPTKEDFDFAGWYKEAACTTAYDFSADVTEAITLYAKWVNTVDLTYNFNYEGSTSKVVEVEKGKAFETLKQVGRPGYYFAGWYKEAACTTEFDPSKGITEATTVYAKWTSPDSYYKFTAQLEKKRIGLRYSGSSDYLGIKPVKGDVITFKFKTPEGKMIDRLYFRDYDGSSGTKVADGGSSSLSVATVSATPDADGWYSFSVTFGDLQSGDPAPYPFSGFLLELIYTGYFKNGDIIEILGFAYNGEELVIANDYHKGIRTTEDGGAGDDTKPTMEIIKL